MRFGKFAGAIALSSCVGLTAVAQQPQPPTTSGQPRTINQGQPGTQQNNMQSNDDMLAHCLIVENQAEIALARMAEGKTKNEEVKKLASMLQKDHQAFVQKLQKFSPNTRGDMLQSNTNPAGQDAGRSNTGNPNERSNLKPVAPTTTSQNPTQPNQQPNQQPGNAQVNNNQVQNGGSNASMQRDRGMNVNQIHQELAQQCLSDAQAKLSKEDGDEFDKCFVGMQIAAHAGMLSKLTVFERHASNDLKQVITEGKKTTKEHMEHAESIMKKLDGDSDKSDNDKSARRDSSTKDKDRSTNKDQ